MVQHCTMMQEVSLTHLFRELMADESSSDPNREPCFVIIKRSVSLRVILIELLVQHLQLSALCCIMSIRTLILCFSLEQMDTIVMIDSHTA